MVWWIAQHLAMTLLLATAAWLVCLWPRVGPATRHALWVLVLAKLMTPPLVTWPWHLPTASDFRGPPAVSETAVFEMLEPQPATEIAATSEFVPPAPASATSECAPLPVATAHTVGDMQPAGQWLPHWTLGAWLAGSALFLIGQASLICRMARRVRAAEPPHRRLAAAVAFQSQRLGLQPVPVGIVSRIVTPMIWAVWRPRLLWPRDLSVELPGDFLNGLVVHELAHVKRRDHWVAWLELIAGACWWWNPLFWYVRRQIRENAELASDACVVAMLPRSRRAYADALLSVCETASRRTPLLPAVGVSKGSRRAFERRLIMIMRERTSFRLSRGGVLGMLLLLGATMPAWSQGQQPKTEEARTGRMMFGTGVNSNAGLAGFAILDEPVQDAVQGETVLLNFSANWCGPCQQLAPTIARLAKSGAPVRNVDIDHEKELAAQFHVNSIPSLILLVEGREVHRQVGGATFESLQGLLAQHGVVPGGQSNDAGGTSSALPADAREAMDGFQRQEAEARRELEARLIERKAELVRQLQELQDRYTREAKLDEAVAIRDQIRKLQPAKAAARMSRSLVGAPQSMAEYRDRIGQTFAFTLTGETVGAVWGTGVYTDDSRLSGAAVHAGALKAGQRGTVRVTMLKGRDSYEASERNGVSSFAYGQWPASYRFENATADYAATPFRDKSVLQDVTGDTTGTVWGSDIYTDDSSIPAAAVHVGLLKPGESGKLRITYLPGRANYSGTTRNGVASHDWKDWSGSFRLEKPAASVLERKSLKGALGDLNSDESDRPEKSRSELEKAVGKLELKLADTVQSTLLGNAKPGESVELEVTGSTEGAVWGSDVYTHDSSLPAAAVHAGLLTPGEKGRIKVTFLDGRDSYEGATRNGVTTSPWRAWERSFKLEKCEPFNGEIGEKR